MPKNKQNSRLFSKNYDKYIRTDLQDHMHTVNTCQPVLEFWYLKLKVEVTSKWELNAVETVVFYILADREFSVSMQF